MHAYFGLCVGTWIYLRFSAGSSRDADRGRLETDLTFKNPMILVLWLL